MGEQFSCVQFSGRAVFVRVIYQGVLFFFVLPCLLSDKFVIVQGIEVGHTFLLGERYSSLFNATYVNERGGTA